MCAHAWSYCWTFLPKIYLTLLWCFLRQTKPWGNRRLNNLFLTSRGALNHLIFVCLTDAVTWFKLGNSARITIILSGSRVLVLLIFKSRVSSKCCLFHVFTAGKDRRLLLGLIISRAWVFIIFIDDAGIATWQCICEYISRSVFFVGDIASGIGVQVGSLDVWSFRNGLVRSWRQFFRFVVHGRGSLLYAMVYISSFRFSNAVAQTHRSLPQSKDVIDRSWSTGIVRSHVGNCFMMILVHFLSDLERLKAGEFVKFINNFKRISSKRWIYCNIEKYSVLFESEDIWFIEPVW